MGKACRVFGLLGCVLALLAGCAGNGSKGGLFSDPYQQIVDKLGIELEKLERHDNGLDWVILQEGNGERPQRQDRVQVHYVGYLLNGKEFDSSMKTGRAFETAVGIGRVIKGWDIALLDMSVGERRILFVPPRLAYGARKMRGIPANSTLVFDMELVRIK